MCSVCHNCILFYCSKCLASNFGLIRPSTGQYLQKLKNAGAYSITRQDHHVKGKGVP